jgi:hypothetical protein
VALEHEGAGRRFFAEGVASRATLAAVGGALGQLDFFVDEFAVQRPSGKIV